MHFLLSTSPLHKKDQNTNHLVHHICNFLSHYKGFKTLNDRNFIHSTDQTINQKKIHSVPDSAAASIAQSCVDNSTYNSASYAGIIVMPAYNFMQKFRTKSYKSSGLTRVVYSYFSRINTSITIDLLRFIGKKLMFPLPFLSNKFTHSKVNFTCKVSGSITSRDSGFVYDTNKGEIMDSQSSTLTISNSNFPYLETEPVLPYTYSHFSSFSFTKSEINSAHSLEFISNKKNPESHNINIYSSDNYFSKYNSEYLRRSVLCPWDSLAEVE